MCHVSSNSVVTASRPKPANHGILQALIPTAAHPTCTDHVSFADPALLVHFRPTTSFQTMGLLSLTNKIRPERYGLPTWNYG